MPGYKLVLLLILLHWALVVAGGLKEALFGKSDGSHALRKGERSTNPKDSLLYNTVLLEEGSNMLMEGYRKRKYCWPPSATVDDGPPIVITMYEALDMTPGLYGGEAREISGGVGKNQVCVEVKSDLGGAGKFQYKFRVYGYKRDLAAEAGLKQSETTKKNAR